MKNKCFLGTVLIRLITKFETLMKEKNKRTGDYSEIPDQLNKRKESLKTRNMQMINLKSISLSQFSIYKIVPKKHSQIFRVNLK